MNLMVDIVLDFQKNYINNNNWYCIPREEYINYFKGDCTKCGSGFNIEGAYLSYKNKIN